jgi:hypothetical protein
MQPSLQKAAFLLGVNYPWLHYGEDFGSTIRGHNGVSLPEHQKLLSEDFVRIRDSGAEIVRWFLFADGRAGFAADRGVAGKPDEFLFQDVAALLNLAEQHQLRLCFSLIDFLWLQDHTKQLEKHPHQALLHFAAGRESFLLHVLIPLFLEFSAHRGLFAWEIANEPEWAIREFRRTATAQMRFADLRVYAAEIAKAAQEFGKVPVTLGSARLMWVRAWSEIGLDFYQAHYYPSAERDAGGNLATQLAALPELDKPLWLGELPAQDPGAAEYSLETALRVCFEAQLYGAAVWRWTAPEQTGTDVPLGQVQAAALRSWIDQARAKAIRA